MLFDKKQMLARMQAKATKESGKAMLAGFLIMETYKDDPDFQNLLKKESELQNIYDIIRIYQNYVKFELEKSIAENQATQNTMKIIEYYNEKIASLAQDYATVKRELEALPNDFGYQVFNKTLFLR